jgi:hypothetical protein
MVDGSSRDNMRRLCPPAAAISRARLRMSCRSGRGAPAAATAGSGRAITCTPLKWLASWISDRGARTSMSAEAQAASGPEAAGQISPVAARVRGDRRREHARDRRDGAVERELAEHAEALKWTSPSGDAAGEFGGFRLGVP